MRAVGGGNFTHQERAALLAPLLAHRKVALAVSGGPDSFGLLALVADWKSDKYSTNVCVYCVDHCLRPEAAAEADAVMAAARGFGFEARVLRWTGDKPKAGLAAAARAARYRLMGEAMAADGATLLVTAHHATDQAETVLMRLGHGSGLGGLGGMALLSEVEGVPVCRPLLGVDPARLEALARHRGLVPFADPSNQDQRSERVRVRQALTGLEAAGIVAGAFGQFALRAARADAALEAMAGRWLTDHALVDPFGVVQVAAQIYEGLDAELQVRALRRLIVGCGSGDYRALGPVEALAGRLRDEPAVTATLGGAAVSRRGGLIRVWREAGRLRWVDQPVEAGGQLLFDGRFLIAADRQPVVVSTGTGLTRDAVERFAGARLELPMAALAAVPQVRDGAGQLLALGQLIRAPGLRVTRCRSDW